MLDVGSRDEDQETSGSLMAMKYFITNDFNTKSSADFMIHYDQECFHFRVNLLDHQLPETLKLIADYVQNPYTVINARKNLKLGRFSPTMEDIKKNEESIFSNAVIEKVYGNQTLGNPLNGSKPTDQIHDHDILNFYIKNISSSKVYVGASGVNDHNDFAKMVQEAFAGLLQNGGSAIQRKPASFSEKRLFSIDEPDSHLISIAIALQSVVFNQQVSNGFGGQNRVAGITSKNSEWTT